MSKLISISVLMMSMAFAAPVMAGEGHSHDKDGGHSNHGHAHGPITAEQAGVKAKRIIGNLIKKGVIENSWASAQPLTTEKKTFKNQEEWVVAFKNDQVKDAAKQSLYIFFSLDGHYLAANYTGK